MFYGPAIMLSMAAFAQIYKSASMLVSVSVSYRKYRRLNTRSRIGAEISEIPSIAHQAMHH